MSKFLTGDSAYNYREKIGDDTEKILNFIKNYVKNHPEIPIKILGHSIKEYKSAQHRVFILPVNLETDDRIIDDDSIARWKNAIMDSTSSPEDGPKKIVARVWNGSARWWNLHSHKFLNCFHATKTHSSFSISDLARAEVAAYRVAQQMLEYTKMPQRRKKKDSTAGKTLTVCGKSSESFRDTIIPDVLYFSHDNIPQSEYDQDNKVCWALFSFVGNSSIHFSENNTGINNRVKNFFYTEELTKRMVKGVPGMTIFGTFYQSHLLKPQDKIPKV